MLTTSRPRRFPGPWVVALMFVTVLSAAVSQAAPVHADAVAVVRAALASARAGSSCGQLRSDPIVEQAAVRVNQIANDWLNHAAPQVPIDDALPGLKILGYSGSKATMLQGAARNETDALKGLLLEGYKSLADCSYKDYGANVLFNERTGYYLSIAVLAGP
jgi:hypothetical protein